MGGERDEQQSCRRAAEPSEHLRAAFEFCHEVEAESHSADRGQAVECVGNQRTFAGKASLREDLRAVIHDGVDTGQLCEDADADEHDAADPWCREVAVGDLVFYGLFLQHVLYLIELHRPLQALFYGANPSCVSILYTKIRGPCHFQYAFSTLLVQLRPVLSAQWSC